MHFSWLICHCCLCVFQGDNLATYGRSLFFGDIKIKSIEDTKPKPRLASLWFEWFGFSILAVVLSVEFLCNVLLDIELSLFLNRQ